jgi:hypothetical protein
MLNTVERAWCCGAITDNTRKFGKEVSNRRRNRRQVRDQFRFFSDPDPDPDPGSFLPPIGSKVSASRTLCEEVSTNRWCVAKKSAPKIGFETAGRMNGTSKKILPLKQTDL